MTVKIEREDAADDVVAGYTVPVTVYVKALAGTDRVRAQELAQTAVVNAISFVSFPSEYPGAPTYIPAGNGREVEIASIHIGRATS